MYVDRADAGRRLADELGYLKDPSTVVLGLPRGGVPVAAEVARALDAPLDIILVRKLGLPRRPELAMGAIGEGGVRVLNPEVLHVAGVDDADLEVVERRERSVLDERAHRYRGARPRLPLRGANAIVVDDGIATGSTALAACEVARAHGAGRVVLAVPVAPAGTSERLAGLVDDFVCPWQPRHFAAIGQFYRDFSQTADDEVVAALRESEARTRRPVVPRQVGPIAEQEVTIPVDGGVMGASLTRPREARGIVLFAHGSGSSRYSPRNRAVARTLVRNGMATLLLDLLLPEEAGSRERVFDIELLTRRLVAATKWVDTLPGGQELAVGYFGASTGAAAALGAAADLPDRVSAVVSRGGRPDLAAARLPEVRTPTLLLVGSQDTAVLALNRRAEQLLLHCEHRLDVVPGATHLFEEPGTMEQVAQAAATFFGEHLRRRAPW